MLQMHVSAAHEISAELSKLNISADDKDEELNCGEDGFITFVLRRLI